MATSIAQYLKDFSKPQAPSMTFETDFSADDFGLDLDVPVLPMPEPVDIEAERKAAHDEAVEATTSELTARFEAEKAELLSAHAEAMGKLVRDLDKKFAASLATGFEKLSAQLAEHVSAQVAEALAPFLTDEIKQSAIRELSEQIEAVISGGEVGKIVVTGPQQLFEQLAELVPDHDEKLQHVPADDLDLSVELGDQILVSRVSAWTASLRKVLG